MEWKKSYTFFLIVAGMILTMFFTSDKIILPRYPFLISILGFTYVIIILSTDAFRIKGQGCLTTLPISKGGHTSIHHNDLRIANPDLNDKDAVKFAVFATGGFSALGFEFKGKEAFCVCPPEYVRLDLESGMICEAKLRQVDFDDIPDYVQDELIKLERFNVNSVKTKNNLYFGLTAKIDGTDTAQNQTIERKFITATQENNYLKETITELREQDRKRREQGRSRLRFGDINGGKDADI
jgi:hypothetical protein